MAVVWEDARHLAFLSRRPNTLGFTVVLPRAHFPSYVFDLPDDDLHALVDAARTVARMLDRHFADVGRTGLILEGFGVDHAHAKLIPMHGTADAAERWRPIRSNVGTYSDTYEGYLSSHEGPLAPLEEQQALAAAIRASNS